MQKQRMESKTKEEGKTENNTFCPPAALEEEEGWVETKQRRRGRGSRGDGCPQENENL